MRRPIGSILGGLALVAVVLAAFSPTAGYYRIVVGPAALSWSPSAVPISYVLQASGSADVPDESEFLAIELAFDTWENLPSSTIAFSEDTLADSSRTDFAATDIHLVMFDENNSTLLFPGASTIVALTPIRFNNGTGQITDADIIFNGEDFTFSTDGTPGTYDIQSIATHEIGHLIGLDHSACGCATMFPFAEAGRTVARSLARDDEAGAESIYPLVAAVGSVEGDVLRASDSSPVGGAHVVALNDDGVVVASTYSSTDGSFRIDRLPVDDYELYAEPLDGPVAGSNLSSDIGDAMNLETDFETTFLGGNATPTSSTVVPGSTVHVGAISVGAAVSPNLTVSSDYPYVLVRGTSPSILILGEDLGPTDTVSVTGSGVTVDSAVYLNLTVLKGFTVQLTIDPGATLGPRTVVVDTSGGDRVVLTGVAEVSEPAPTVDSVSPTMGIAAGGETVTITGTGFQNDLVLIFGDALAASVTVDSATQITATTPTHADGTVSIFVQNPDGQLGELDSAFTFFSQPVVDSIFPSSGSSAGGTAVSIHGNSFLAGATVDVGGSSATVSTVTTTRIDIVTPAGALGAADVVVTNPGGGTTTVTGGFTYVGAPDPAITAVFPTTGSTAGGTEITVTGSNFDPGAQVFFGQAGDGSGGSAATSVMFVSANELTVVTPASAAGDTSVTVRNPSGASFRSPAAFTYIAPSGGGGGGGGCFGAVPGAPLDSSGGGLMPPALLLLLVALARAWAQRARARVPMTTSVPGSR